MEQPFFKPWVGKNYQTGGIFGKRILVLGESHYCGEDCKDCGCSPDPWCSDFTSRTVLEYLNHNKIHKDWMNTYLKFERSLVNKETNIEESQEIWQSIAFYNYLQIAMTRARKAGSNKDYKCSQKPFLKIINQLEPDLIIVWGVGNLFENMPEERWIKGDSLIIDGYHVKNGYYQLTNGIKSRCIAVYHPSTGYSWDWWYKVISSQL